MELKEIYEKLCWNDVRNPDNDPNYPNAPRSKSCMCDNCFYGRDKLAVALLEAYSLLKRVTNYDEYDTLPNHLFKEIDNFVDNTNG